MKINAATRLLATKTKDLSNKLRRFDVQYDSKNDTIYVEHVDNDDVEAVVSELDKMGYKVAVDTNRKRFKAKGAKGLVVQRDDDYLEVYFD